jgi:hypothetical protein
LAWNYPGEFRCARCGVAWEKSGGRREQARSGDPGGRCRDHPDSDRDFAADRAEIDRCQSSSSPSPRGPEEEEEIDEFGRAARPKSLAPTKRKGEWPPPFEESGSAFVFDSRCGMFYESVSDFFYDPKS